MREVKIHRGKDKRFLLYTKTEATVGWRGGLADVGETAIFESEEAAKAFGVCHGFAVVEEWGSTTKPIVFVSHGPDIGGENAKPIAMNDAAVAKLAELLGAEVR